jgi:folylpolyglutamate synthase/dihydropteroate synthase
VILTGVRGNRAKTMGMLLDEAKDFFNMVLTAHKPEEAMDLIRKASDPSDTIVVTGSFYLVGEARRILNHD